MTIAWGACGHRLNDRYYDHDRGGVYMSAPRCRVCAIAASSDEVNRALAEGMSLTAKQNAARALARIQATIRYLGRANEANAEDLPNNDEESRERAQREVHYVMDFDGQPRKFILIPEVLRPAYDAEGRPLAAPMRGVFIVNTKRGQYYMGVDMTVTSQRGFGMLTGIDKL